MRSASHIIIALMLALLSLAANAQETDTVVTAPVVSTAQPGVPAAFRAPGQNVITDTEQHLYPIYLALLDIKADEYLDSLRVMHIGDSHIRGHIFPQTFGKRLAADFGAVKYRDLGINGATYSSYVRSGKLEDVYAWQPDLVIISFGTNEAYGRYVPETHYRHIDELVVLLQENLPYACLLLTTPAGCYLKGGRHNPANLTCAETIDRYAREHGLPVYDLFAVAGGEANACANWKRTGMMRGDGVHFTPAGYTAQGNMLYEAFRRAYDEAVKQM
ncbi:MAG: lipase [Bacteroidaceae bacterium]|nr:lipase [Bacteroidaceae bacterium]